MLCSLLLLLAGDIERNPGPSVLCPVCHRNYSRSRGAVRCSSCSQWLCLSQHCSGLTNTRHYTPGWQCKICLPAPNIDIRIPTPPHTAPTSAPCPSPAATPTPVFPVLILFFPPTAHLLLPRDSLVLLQVPGAHFLLTLSALLFLPGLRIPNLPLPLVPLVPRVYLRPHAAP